LGSVLCSCCNAFFSNVYTTIVNKWFTDKERALATALVMMASPIGSGISFGMTGYWFKDYKESENDDSQEFLTLFKTLMITQFLITTINWFIFNLVIKE